MDISGDSERVEHILWKHESFEPDDVYRKVLALAAKFCNGEKLGMCRAADRSIVAMRAPLSSFHEAIHSFWQGK
jgi:hypothetical protein